MTQFVRLAAASALLLIATPSFAAPLKPVLPGSDARYSQGSPVTADTTDAWWETFGDEALNRLVVEAIESNYDIASAQARVLQAQGVSVQQFSPLVPSASFDLGLNASPTAAQGFQIPPSLIAVLEALNNIPGQPAEEDPDEDKEDPDVTWNGSALFNFGLNIDIGSTALAFRAALMDKAAAEGDRDGVARQLVAQVVSSWMDVRNARARVAVIEEQIATNVNLLELTRNRFEGGDASGLDVLQQQQQLANTRSLLPQSQQVLRLQEQRLAVLLARDPSTITQGLPPAVGLPALPPAPGLGTPQDLLDLRPDLVALQARLLGSKARKDSAILGFLPTFRLSGNVGWNLRWFDEWESGETWGLGVGVSVPIFNGGRRWGAVQQANAAQRAATYALSAGINQAQSEVEQALAREETEAARLAAVEEQLRDARVAYTESTRQYSSGLATYLSVLANLASLQGAELNQLQAQRDLLGARIDLHTALGAPWADRLSEGASR
ncbi:MAG: TolC family protein [Deltaproteobacteria bacterium]|nr:TolC family protein [Deltaproteobacteria bacterium]